MRNSVVAAAALAGAFVLCSSSASAGKLIPLPAVTGSVLMGVGGINDNNVMTGDYETADGQVRGWVGTLDGSYTLFDAPEGGAEGRGINNNGYITVIANPSGDRIYGDSLLRKPDGTLSPIKMSGDIIDGLPQGIIKNQRFVGDRWYFDQNDQLLVSGYYAKGNRYQADLTLPFETVRTRPRGLNSEGEVVGYFRRSGELSYGFVLKDGIVTEVHYPDERAFVVYLEAVNNSGQIVGGWQDENQTAGNAFYYKLADDSFDVIDVPGSTWSYAVGLNKRGVATIISDAGAFIYCPRNKGCPAGANAVQVKPRHLSGSMGRSTVCEHGCLGQPRVLPEKPTDPVALQRAVARDPELQRDLRLPFRP